MEQIKRWERKEVKENSLPVVKKLHVKVGDTVKVISGHDKGKIKLPIAWGSVKFSGKFGIAF